MRVFASGSLTRDGGKSYDNIYITGGAFYAWNTYGLNTPTAKYTLYGKITSVFAVSPTEAVVLATALNAPGTTMVAHVSTEGAKGSEALQITDAAGKVVASTPEFPALVPFEYGIVNIA